MKTLNCLRTVVMCFFAIGLWSCGDDVYYTMENSDKKLCDRTWINEFETDEGKMCTYQLRFFKDSKKGQELTTTYDDGGKTTVDREFSWRWTDDSKEALKLSFADETVKYFENVWVRDHYLSGELDGKAMVMTDANYVKN